MKTIITIALFSSAAVLAVPSIPGHEWLPPGKGEVRGPCPGLNVLANHGILPRDGGSMDREMILGNLKEWYNIDETVSEGLFERAVNSTGRPNATTFNMTDIRLHHNATVLAIEADASFSRADAFWGNNYDLNYTVWNQTRSFWQGESVDVQEFGNAARARYLTSKATNPTFYFPDVERIGFAMSFMANVLGDAAAGTVRTDFVDDWIVKERLPAHLGWSTSKNVTDGPSVGGLGAKIFTASGLNSTADRYSKRGGFMHSGIYV